MKETIESTQKEGEQARVRLSSRLNWLLFACEAFSLGWMFLGLSGGPFSARRLTMFRYFTVDSNFLLGIFALLAAAFEGRAASGKKGSVPSWVYICKLMGTVGVTLTLLVTVFFLAPTSKSGYFSLFLHSNFFLHLVNPLLALAVFLGFERTGRIPFPHTFTGILPMALYSVYYIEEALTHIENGVIAKGYDWYGFFVLGPGSLFCVFPLLLLITYLISWVLWRANGGRRKDRQKD